jgi:hypothetical protein
VTSELLGVGLLDALAAREFNGSLSMRTLMRRFIWLTIGFSKKFENPLPPRE